jgi:uncharacterized membrane protein
MMRAKLWRKVAVLLCPSMRWQGLAINLMILTVVLGSYGAADAFTRTFNFCNKSIANVEVAYGYEPAGSNNTQTKGWRSVLRCQCVTLFSEDVRATEAYVYVTKEGSSDAFMDGAAPLCIRRAKFQVGPSNDSKKRCIASGGEWVNFQQVNTPKTVHTLNFGSGGNCR